MKKTILLITTAFLWFSIYVYNPYLTPELLAQHAGAALAGFIVGMRPFVQMGVRFPMGLLLGRKGRHKACVVAGTGVSACAAAIMYVSPTPLIICLGCVVAGFASATYVAYTVLYGAYFPKGHNARAMAAIGAVEYGSTFAAFVIGGTLYHQEGIRVLFLLAAIAGALGFVISLFVKDEKLPPAEERASDIRRLLRNPQLRSSCILGILVKLVAFGTAFSFTSKLAEDMGATGLELGIVNGLYIAAAALSSVFVATKAARRLGDAHMSLTGFILLCIYCGTLPFVRTPWIFMVLQFLGGWAFGSLSAVFMSNAVRTLKPSQKDSGMGFYQSAYSLGMGLGSIVTGLFADWISYAAGFIAVGCFAAAGVVFTLWAKSKDYLPSGRVQGT